MTHHTLEHTAAALVAEGRGILAADESTGTIKKRFDTIDIESTEDSRRAYRGMIFGTPGLGEYITGVILYDETIRQSTTDGTPFPKLLDENGIKTGIKIDTGAKPLAGADGEQVTEGLDGLRERLEEYRELGASFTKWRAVVNIGADIPSPYCLEANAHALARQAALAQEAGLVPIIEPEAIMEGEHSIDRCYEVTHAMLQAVFEQLFAQRVAIEGTVLKTNMVLSGTKASTQASVEEVAEATVRCLRAVVPPAVPGIAFLSGGQSEELATAHLNAMNKLGPQPWELSFSYGRALLEPSLKAWKGEESNDSAAQDALLHRARLNGAARSGSYTPEMEGEAPAA